MTKIMCLAGFGDNASMFAPIIDLANRAEMTFEPLNLPGFGAPAFTQQETTLNTLAAFVNAQARATGTQIVLAHSVASIIASLAANAPHSPIKIILSLEGNLTPEDAYFSGTAAQYDTPDAFRAAFLDRLDNMSADNPVMTRYRDEVSDADPQALWELGYDAHHFSASRIPGELLQRAAHSIYLYNPDNVPESSLAWLANHDLQRLVLPEASHWASLDKPTLLIDTIQAALDLP